MVKLKEENELGNDYDYYLRGYTSNMFGVDSLYDDLHGPAKKQAVIHFVASCDAEEKKNWYDDVLANSTGEKEVLLRRCDDQQHLSHGYLEITKVAKSAVTPHIHIFAIGDRVRANGQTQFYRIDENSSGTIIALDQGPCNCLLYTSPSPRD